MRLGDSDLVWENDHADVAEDRPDVDQPSQTAKGPGEALIRVATYSEGHQGSLARSRPQTQSMAFFSTAVMELLYSGEAMSRPS